MDRSESFEEMLRQALNHLYEPEFLRHSSLLELLEMEHSERPATDLRVVIQKGIESLRPDPKVSPASKRRRYYELLRYRYVEQLTQSDTAQRLSISSRHLRREQAAAIHALASYLRTHFGWVDEPTAGPDHVLDVDVPPTRAIELNQEMLWLADSLADQSTMVEPVFQEAMELAAGLARENSVSLDTSVVGDPPPVAVADIVLKQIVLNLVCTAIPSVSGGQVTLVARGERDRVVIDVVAKEVPGEVGHSAKWGEESVAMSRQLAKMFHGGLDLFEENGTVTARLSFPSVDQVLVLAIEDNADALQLWQRFVRNTRFCLVGENDPERALEAAVELQPALIVLDIMMPEIDGWELLRQLRQHPVTVHIPVVVCTVLPQKELACSLGANGFIRKPTTGREFRCELERQIAAARHG